MTLSLPLPVMRILAWERGYVPLITVMTICYLIVELGFNARLLDAAGQLTDIAEIDSIETWGRLISGAAVTLFVWGSILMPLAWSRGWPAKQTLVCMCLSGAALTGVTFFAEKALVDHLVDHSNGNMRRAAAELSFVSRAVRHGEISIKRIDLTPQVLASPEGKSFMALFPFLAISTPNLQTDLTEAIAAVALIEAQHRAGSPERAYNTSFRHSVEMLRSAYNRYADLGKAAAAVDPERLWEQYRETLERQENMTPERVPLMAWRHVAQAVRRMGVPVPTDWNPQDHLGFVAAARTAANHVAEVRGPDNLPLGMTWQQFVDTPSIQAKWRAALTSSLAIAESVHLRPDMTFGEFKTEIFDPLIRETASQQVSTFERSAHAFEDGEVEQTLGREAMEFLLVPPIALLFSLAGALTHTFKSIRYIFALRRASKQRDAIVAVCVLSVAALAFLAPNQVTRSDAFRTFSQRAEESSGFFVTTGIVWILQAQPYAYPVDEWVRLHLLGGYRFGYNNKEMDNGI